MSNIDLARDYEAYCANCAAEGISHESFPAWVTLRLNAQADQIAALEDHLSELLAVIQQWEGGK